MPIHNMRDLRPVAKAIAAPPPVSRRHCRRKARSPPRYRQRRSMPDPSATADTAAQSTTPLDPPQSISIHEPPRHTHNVSSSLAAAAAASPTAALLKAAPSTFTTHNQTAGSSHPASAPQPPPVPAITGSQSAHHTTPAAKHPASARPLDSTLRATAPVLPTPSTAVTAIVSSAVAAQQPPATAAPAAHGSTSATEARTHAYQRDDRQLLRLIEQKQPPASQFSLERRPISIGELPVAAPPLHHRRSHAVVPLALLPRDAPQPPAEPPQPIGASAATAGHWPHAPYGQQLPWHQQAGYGSGYPPAHVYSTAGPPFHHMPHPGWVWDPHLGCWAANPAFAPPYGDPSAVAAYYQPPIEQQARRRPPMPFFIAPRPPSVAQSV